MKAENIEEDFKWYIENKESLFNQYGNNYIAIKGKKVIGCYKSYAEGVKTTKQKESIGTFIVQRCGKDESAYTNYISSVNFIIDTKETV